VDNKGVARKKQVISTKCHYTETQEIR
jgi:hypothetical protein